MAYSTLLQPEGLEQRYERYKEKIKYFTDSKKYNSGFLFVYRWNLQKEAYSC